VAVLARHVLLHGHALACLGVRDDRRARHAEHVVAAGVVVVPVCVDDGGHLRATREWLERRLQRPRLLRQAGVHQQQLRAGGQREHVATEARDQREPLIERHRHHLRRGRLGVAQERDAGERPCARNQQ
jgi:hypothetical protein